MWTCRLALVSTPCCHPSTAASWPWCLLYSHDRSQPQRWKHTELSHSSNFFSGLWESGAILFPSSAEDLLVSAGEMETWRFFFPTASATSDRGSKKERLGTSYWDIMWNPAPTVINSRVFPSSTVFLGQTFKFFLPCSQHCPVSLMPWDINLKLYWLPSL